MALELAQGRAFDSNPVKGQKEPGQKSRCTPEYVSRPAATSVLNLRAELSPMFMSYKPNWLVCSCSHVYVYVI